MGESCEFSNRRFLKKFKKSITKALGLMPSSGEGGQKLWQGAPPVLSNKFTDSAISGSKVNGDHKEKVLQRWEGGDSNGESYDLESDAVNNAGDETPIAQHCHPFQANGWDPNEMFRYNEENYGIKSTYDSSLSLYTVPLEKGTSEQFRQREARAAKLASEIESSPQYRQRVSVENDEGRSEEDKYSSVVRDRDCPRDRDRDSPSFGREGKYIPLPQRARESGGVRGGARGGSPSPRGSLSSRTALPPRSGSAHPSSLTDTNQASRGSYSGHPHHHHHHHHASGFQSHHGEPRGATDPAASPSLRGSAVESGAGATPLSLAGSPSDLPPPSGAPSTETVAPQSTGQPQSNQSSTGTAGSPGGQEQQRVLNGGVARASFTPKSGGSSQDSRSTSPYLDNTPVSTATSKLSGPAPTFNVDVNEIINSGGGDRALESPGNAVEPAKPCLKVPTEHQRNQLEELRKFGKEFRLQSSGGTVDSEPGSKDVGSGSADPKQQRESCGSVESVPVQTADKQQQSEPQAESSADRQSPGTPAAARTPSEGDERPEGLPE
ncbi:UNVERIFIED_CONTAM: hypothetical protein FKN15_051293 [Acipenser sinensis]